MLPSTESMLVNYSNNHSFCQCTRLVKDPILPAVVSYQQNLNTAENKTQPAKYVEDILISGVSYFASVTNGNQMGISYAAVVSYPTLA